jgi:phage gp36-like protein
MIVSDESDIAAGINAAVKEMVGYLNSRYDCVKIFSATGDERDALVVEHCKSIAVWYIIRRSNADVIFEKVQIYYNNAKEWLRLVSGTDKEGKPIAADLPLREDADGNMVTQLRMGSNPKFTHSF